MYGSRILILGSLKKVWYVRSAENPTPTWLRFQLLDSASAESATSSSLGKVTRIQFLQIPSWLQDFQKFHKKPQCSSTQQFQVAKLPVQWMPFPQYPLRCRKEILLLDNPKEFHPRDLDYRNDIPCIEVTFNIKKWYSMYRHSSCTDILISEREMVRYGSEWHYRENRI